jgi:uncharacterized membrane protein YbjE (DUF340 family)
VNLDLFLYVAFGGGFVAGRLIRWRSPRIGDAATVLVGVLLFLLGDGLGTLPVGALLNEIPLAATFAAATLAATVLLVLLLTRVQHSPPVRYGPLRTRPNFLTPVGFVLALLAGAAVGRIGGHGPGPLTEFALYGLLAVVGFELKVDVARIRSAWIPITAAVSGGLAVAVVFAVSGLVSPLAVFSSAFAFGWYSLAGPLTAARLGPALGLFAFLANFLRENLTMLSAPWIGRRVGGEGLAAMGGATSMDTTLYFVTRYGDPDAATLALATGIVLTTSAGLLLPLILGIPQG